MQGALLHPALAPALDGIIGGRRSSASSDEIRIPSLTGRSRGPFSFCETAVRRRPRITAARLRELLHYDPVTGEFRWVKSLNPKIHVGDIAGTLANGYRKITIRGREYAAHQLAWLYMTGKWCSALVDHRDGNRSNNRWDNLRHATPSQNSANRRMNRNNKCGFKGVIRAQSGRWCASIYKNGRSRHLGTFSTPEAAHAAYMTEARKLFGEFARAA
jgi:HNH endonuclease